MPLISSTRVSKQTLIILKWDLAHLETSFVFSFVFLCSFSFEFKSQFTFCHHEFKLYPCCTCISLLLTANHKCTQCTAVTNCVGLTDQPETHRRNIPPPRANVPPPSSGEQVAKVNELTGAAATGSKLSKTSLQFLTSNVIQRVWDHWVKACWSLLC